MKGSRKWLLSMLFVFVITVLFAVPVFAKPKLNKKEVTIVPGQHIKLTVTGAKRKPKWCSSNKKIAAVTKTGEVRGRKAGRAVIKAKVNGKTLKCKVTVTAPSSNPPQITGSDPDAPGSGQNTEPGSNNGLVLTFRQDGWYVARLEIQLYDKKNHSLKWIYSKERAIGQRTTVTIDTDHYEINRVGYQIWFFGWDNDYMNVPYANTNNATTFTLSGSGDFPEFTWE